MRAAVVASLVVAASARAEAAPRPPVPRWSEQGLAPAVDAPAELRFEPLAELEADDRYRPASAVMTADRAYILLDRGPSWMRGVGLTLVIVAFDGSAPKRLAVPVGERGQLRAVDDGVEVMTISPAAVRLLHWSDARGWREVQDLPVDPGMIGRFDGGWLALVSGEVEDGWVIDRGIRTTLALPPGIGVYRGAMQQVHDVVALGDGALILVSDSTSADGQHAGSPGRTRAILYARGHARELTDPFPWLDERSVIGSAGGPRVALIRETFVGTGVDRHAETHLVVVDDVGRALSLPAPFARGWTLRWIGGVLVAQDASLRGWTWTPGTGAVEPIPLPAGTPRAWFTWTRARLGDQLCAWGGGIGRRSVGVARLSNAAICVDPITRVGRLASADPPLQWTYPFSLDESFAGPPFLADCEVLADGPRGLIRCIDARDGGAGVTLWTVTH